ncbi:MAG: hypothetical protein EAZ95_08500 [Bacteroidetes bacterium]|nr:MAG: hypothetical protein EAZ95_08500 [Bacteroidota bacterium]
MYLSIQSSHKLNEVVLNFEVAYRSFIAENMVIKFPTENDFKIVLEDLSTKTVQTSIIFSHRFSEKIKAIKKEYKKHYKVLQDCNAAFNLKIINEIEAPFVSTLNDYVTIFYNSYFANTDLLKGISPNDYLFLAEKYHKIRNDLFHPATCKILLTDAKEITQFLRKISLNIDSIYFWYVNKIELEKSIQAFIESIEGNPIKICNLDEITFGHQKIVCRDSELNKLDEYIFGKKDVPFYRTAGSVAVYGYGGLGKTALVIEFLINVIKQSIDENNPHKIEFMLFFTNKEEQLSYSKTSGEIIIQDLKKQINSFSSFQENLFQYLSIQSVTELSKFGKGIIVIDNIETFNETDKTSILEFIKTSPNNIQYIITSRYEENAVERLHIEGFSDVVKGKEFVKQYLSLYNLFIELDDKRLEALLDASKGNTLILVLSLQQLSDGITTFAKITETLGNTKSANIEKIVDFMYKNTFDKVIKELEKQNPNFNVRNVLTVISMYKEAIDLYSLAELTESSVSIVEKICDYLANRLILNKKGEYYELNDFANKFVLVKFIPDKIVATKLYEKIDNHKFTLRLKLRKFEEKKNDRELERIMDDWKPQTQVEKIAIVNAYSLFSPYNSGKDRDIEKLKKEFAKYEAMTPHPYIKFQKAKIFEMLVSKNFITTSEALDIISNSYEDVIYSIEFEYKYIKTTKSFANVLWFYGQFLVKNYEDYQQALPKLEQARTLFKKLDLTSDLTYKNLLKSMINSYQELSKNKSYRGLYNQEVSELRNELNSLPR